MTFSSPVDKEHRLRVASEALINASINVVKMEQSLHEMKALKASVSSIDSKMTVVQRNTTSIDSKMAAMAMTATSVDSKMGTVQASTASIDSKMLTIETSAASIDSKMAVVESKASSTNDRIENLEKQLEMLCQASSLHTDYLMSIANATTALTSQLKGVMKQVSAEISDTAKSNKVHQVISMLKSGVYDLRFWFQNGHHSLLTRDPELYFRDRDSSFTTPIGHTSSYLSTILAHCLACDGFNVEGVSFNPGSTAFNGFLTVPLQEKAFRDGLVKFFAQVLGCKPRVVVIDQNGLRYEIYLDL